MPRHYIYTMPVMHEIPFFLRFEKLTLLIAVVYLFRMALRISTAVFEHQSSVKYIKIIIDVIIALLYQRQKTAKGMSSMREHQLI